MDRKKIVVLGAGFGGLRAAIVIAKKLRALRLLEKYEVILLDQSEHHTYTPLLYEVATTSKEVADIMHLHEVATHHIPFLIRHLPITFLRAEVQALDLTEGMVHLEHDSLSWQVLVIALGSETNYYDIPGLEKYAFTLKTFRDAIRIRDAVWNLAMSAKSGIRIVLGGGGSTGCELAGELKAWCGQLEKEFPRCRLEVAIVEAAPTILPEFAPRVIALVKDRLEKLHVTLIEGKKIKEAKKDKVVLEDGRDVPFDVLVWTGGVKAASVLAQMPLKTEARGRIEVIGQMECLPQRADLKLYSKIYGLGDSVCFYDPITKKPIPGVARAAISQANIVAYNVVEDIKAEERPGYRPFHHVYQPMEYPYIIPVGGKYAVSKLGPIIISGFWGWFLKGLVEINYLLSIMPFTYALTVWLKGLKIFIQNDRLG